MKRIKTAFDRDLMRSRFSEGSGGRTVGAGTVPTGKSGEAVEEKGVMAEPEEIFYDSDNILCSYKRTKYTMPI